MPEASNSGSIGQTASSARSHAAVQRMASLYKAFALVFFNTVLAYLLLNLIFGAIFWARAFHQPTGSNSNPVAAKYSEELLDFVYPDLSRLERHEMLSEIWNRPYIYEDFTHFQERPCSGKYVNVTKEGYRKCANQGPWPPSQENLNVFVFGGSTTFGYGVPDYQTIASFLQEELSKHCAKRVCVYDFGVGWYYSTQERIRFEKLLTQHYIPKVAVFIDGINETKCTSNAPAFSHEMARAFESVAGFDESQSPSRPGSDYWRIVRQVGFERMPIGRAGQYLSRKFGRGEHRTDAPEVSLYNQSLEGCKTYLVNKAMIEMVCHRFQVAPVFVWQPAPGYRYDAKYHLFASPEADMAIHNYYETMRELLEKEPQTPDFLWCADMQEGRRECLYCDHLHYTAAFSRSFAARICELSLERNLIALH